MIKAWHTSALALLLASGLLAPAGAAPAAPAELLQNNCSGCHNSNDWAGGLAFDTLSADKPQADAEVWEKAIRKLRGRLMPPPGEPQPSQQHIDSFVGWMEQQLDQAAAQTPDPGYVGLHRLNRTEYGREIYRLLGIAVDVKTLLPKDVSNEGFDNVAASLRVSPTYLDQYITAARTISRQAVGRVNIAPSSREYRANPAADQTRHIAGLPLGTRGGLMVEHYFPADGEYEFNIRNFFFHGAGYITKIDQPHRVVMTIDDTRVFEQSFGGADDLKAVDVLQSAAAEDMQNRFNHIRLKITAGTHRVGVAFVQRSFAQSDSPLQPIAMLPEMERVPGIPGFDVSGPFKVTGITETVSRQRIFQCRPANATEELPCARSILSRLASEAFRRPANEEDLQAPLAFYKLGRESGDFDAGIESGLTAILASTKFLVRTEPTAIATGAQPGKPTPLSDLELASRLAFFLWSQGPDQALINSAAAGKLHEPAELEAQVRRMLASPRSESLVTNFAFQWLNIPRIDSIQPDPVFYPNFDPDLRDGYREEIRLFLNSVLRADRSVLDLLRSDETFVNERVATAYGLKNIRGAQFRPVRLSDANRHGLFGKGAVLLGTSYGNRTSPVLRGSWVLENILGTPPSPPPPGVEAFLEVAAGQPARTVRERLESHRAAKSCNACHGVIDPLGFALENYDVAGVWRDRDLDAGTRIDASGTLASGQPVGNPAQLNAALLARPDQFVQTLTEKLMVYGLGRPLRAQDMPAVRSIVRQAAVQNYSLQALVSGIVRSDAFRMNLLPPASVTPRTAQAEVRDRR